MTGGKPPAFVLGLFLPGLDILKTLVTHGVQCEGFDCKATAPAMKLKRIPVARCPDPEKNEREFVEFLLDRAKIYDQPPVILVTADSFVRVLQNNRGVLRSHFRFYEDAKSAISRLMSKKGMYEAANEQGVDVPQAIFPRSVGELEAQLHRLQFPLLIKPLYAHHWRTPAAKSQIDDQKVIKVHNEAALFGWYERVNAFDSELMIQEIATGPDENLYYLVVLLDQKGKPLGHFCGRKIRITPIHFGSASYMHTTDPDELENRVFSFLENVGYRGPAGVEFKKDERDGRFKLIEVNARFGLWDVIGRKLGVDVFWLAYQDLADLNPQRRHPRRVRIAWLSVSRDIPAYLQYRRAGELSFIPWLRTYFGNVYFADLYWDEPFVMYSLYVGKLIRKFRKTIRKMRKA